MFDTIQGLPLHPLVVHLVVVLGPLAALMLLAHALVPRWRGGLRWPTLLLAAVAAASAWVAVQAGQNLRDRLGEPTFDHAAKGQLAAIAVYTFLGATVLVVLLLCRPGATGALNTLGVLVAVGAVGFLMVTVLLAGHSGAESVWQEQVAATTTSAG